MRINDEKVVIKMYVENMLSMVQIGEKLSISPSTVRRILDINNIPRRSISDEITNLFITKFGKVPCRPKQELSSMEIDLKITGIMLYWGEGAKSSGAVNFSNSNPEMIKVFLLFLRTICGVDEKRIKILIHTYPDQNYDGLQKFWMKMTHIKKENFYRPHVHCGKIGSYKNKSLYGTASVSYCDKRLLKVILNWINEYKDAFLKITPA
jgi:hypothetical protein